MLRLVNAQKARGRISARKPELEGLEERLALSGAQVHAKAVLGTISGQIVNTSNNKPVSNIMVQLYNQDGTKIATTTTGRQGHYAFKIKAAGAYVVREVLPKRLVQTSPTFATGAPPTGAYVAGAGNTSWNYTTSDDNPANGPVGPYAWDTIAPAGDEPFQSPINLTGPTVDLSKYITVNYATSTPTDILNNTHQFQVQYSPVSTTDTVTVGGTTFNLAQFHYHDPAENHVDGHVYQLEEHFVNTAASGAETVVAVFFKLGAHNSALDPILNAASGLTTPNAKTTNTTPIDFSGLLPTNTQGYFFEGSLTTPPLSQPVNWFVYATPITLDYAQLKQYETAAGAGGFLPNARPLQALDGRILNEIDANVSFTTQSVGGVNFTVAKA